MNWDRKVRPEDRKELEGLLCYRERSPVSLRRLTYRADGMVHYQGSKFHPRLGVDHQLLTPIAFLALLIPHVLLRYEVSIRTYGALSTTLRPQNTHLDGSMSLTEVSGHRGVAAKMPIFNAYLRRINQASSVL